MKKTFGDTLFSEAFILKPRAASQKEINKANIEAKRSDDRVFLPAEEALKRARTTKGSNLTKLMALAMHPDELVRIALLTENPSFNVQHRRWAVALTAVVYTTDTQYAVTDVLWNPVYDAVAQKAGHAWAGYTWRRLQEHGFGGKYKRNVSVSDYSHVDREKDPWAREILASAAAPLTLDERLDRVAGHFNLTKAPEGEIEQLLTAFKAWPIHELIGERISWEWSKKKADRWMPGRPGLIVGVMEGRKLGASVQPFAFKEAIRYMASQVGGYRTKGGIIASSAGACAAENRYIWTKMSVSEDIKRPENWIEVQKLFQECLQSNSSSRKLRWPLLHYMSASAMYLEGEQLGQLFHNLKEVGAGGNMSGWYHALARAPKAPAKLLLEILDATSSSDVREAVARHPMASDKAVAERLSHSTNYKIGIMMAPKVSGKIFEKMVKRAMDRDGARGVGLIEARPDASEHLAPKVMIPALMHTEKEIRLKATMMVGKMKKKIIQP